MGIMRVLQVVLWYERNETVKSANLSRVLVVIQGVLCK